MKKKYVKKMNKGKKKIKKVMEEFKTGSLKIGTSDKPVVNQKQAVAIALAEARKKGARIPKKRNK